MKKRHTPEQIVRKLRQADAELAEGAPVPEVAKRCLMVVTAAVVQGEG